MKETQYNGEATAKVGDIEIVYDSFGEHSAPPMLLIVGLGAQMIRWDDAFCQLLAAQGYWVIRFDNRDVGLSSKFDDSGVPNALELIQAVQKGVSPDVPYLLKDMAADAVGLLDELGIESAHIVGTSMGGMIAQTIAIHYPDRVRTLTSIMSSTNHPDLPQPTPEAMSVLLKQPPSNRVEFIESSVESSRVLYGTKYPLNEDYVREYAGRAFDRCYYPDGTGRQLAAVLASGSRRDALQGLKVPTLVIHGDADPLVPVEGGKDTAESIPGAKLFIVEGMGHSIPEEVAPEIITEIARHAL